MASEKILAPHFRGNSSAGWFFIPECGGCSFIQHVREIFTRLRCVTYQKTIFFMVTLILANILPDRPTGHWDLQLRESENNILYDNADTC
jgi:hypothetical protein